MKLRDCKLWYAGRVEMPLNGAVCNTVTVIIDQFLEIESFLTPKAHEIERLQVVRRQGWNAPWMELFEAHQHYHIGHCQFLEIESFSRTLTWTRRIMVRPVLNYVVHSISSFHHFIISSFHYFIISSFHHFIISSFHHHRGWKISSFHHFIITEVEKNVEISSFHHFIIWVIAA